MKKPLIFILALTFTGAVLGAQDNFQRFALFIGANDGGPGRTALRYAATDAWAMSSVMQELGGLSQSNVLSLVNPTRQTILVGLGNFQQRIAQAHSTSARVEFLFYYSGHSDEEGLLIGKDKITYPELRDSLNRLQADVRLAVLDSCSSGAFTRLKGGKKTAPFMVDESSALKGHAYLTSSSESEASQESDRIGGSFFTHYLISGLRGAADTTGDGRVTLNEVYYHAFKETLARTENTQAGPQHPSYDIQLTGTGDLVLTDLSTQSCRLVLSKDIEGRVFIRTAKGQLMAEVQKKAGENMPIALAAGDYVVSVQTGAQYATTKQKLVSGDMKILTPRDLVSAAREATRSRGDDEPINETAQTAPQNPEQKTSEEGMKIVIDLPKIPHFDIPFLPFFNSQDPAEEQLPGQMEDVVLNIGLVPWLELHPGLNKRVQIGAYGLIAQAAEVQGFQAAGILGITGKLQGFQASGIGSLNSGSLKGFQGSGIFNINLGSAEGFQGGGIFNLAGKDLKGFQGGGIFNFTGGELKGFQGAGIFNVAAGELEGFQGAGIGNIAGKVRGFQASGIVNIAGDVEGFQASLVNKAGNVKGLQVGLVNIADEVDGASIALITIAKNATYQVFTYWDTQDYVWNTLQWGVGGFYSVIFLGSPRSEYLQTGANLVRGYGLGWKWGKEWNVSMDLSMKAVPGPNANWDTWWTEAREVPGLRISGGAKFGPFALSAGYNAQFHFPGWTEEGPLNSGPGASATSFMTSGYEYLVKGTWFWGVGVGL